MKRRNLFVLILSVSLLFTSCLADYLNDKFNYKVPVFITYSSSYGQVPETKRFPSETSLTAEVLPELTEEGWDFCGWYLDENFQKPATSGTSLSQNTILYAKWAPRTDTPFTIHNYFLDPRNTGLADFILRSDLTQHYTGTTNEVIDQELYDVRYSDLYDSELDNFEYIYFSHDELNEVKIKADGSTVVNNYYYLNKIFDNEFETIISALPDTPWCYWFYFLQGNSDFDFSTIRDAINEYSNVTETYYNQSLGRDKKRYNKHFALILTGLDFTILENSLFNNMKALNQVNLPSTCTLIRGGTFYNCEDLDYVYTNNEDYTKHWKTNDDDGNEIDLGPQPDARELANLLRTSYHEVWFE